MKAGNGVPSRGPLRGRAPRRVGASRMPRGRRRPAQAKAWGSAQDRLTSGRYRARASGESGATRQHSGLVPEGGLARHAVEASPPAGLPPPKAKVPSRAT
jgi:hypothetical protein